MDMSVCSYAALPWAGTGLTMVRHQSKRSYQMYEELVQNRNKYILRLWKLRKTESILQHSIELVDYWCVYSDLHISVTLCFLFRCDWLHSSLPALRISWHPVTCRECWTPHYKQVVLINNNSSFTELIHNTIDLIVIYNFIWNNSGLIYWLSYCLCQK